MSALLIEGADVYATGNVFFSSSVYHWDGNAWATLGTINLSYGYGFSLTSLVRFGGYLYAGGWVQITDGGETIPVLVKWDGSTWSTNYFSSSYRGAVSCLKTDGTYLYLGGQLWQPYMFPPLYDAILRFDGTNLSSLGDGLQYQVNDIEWFNGQLHAVGSIESSGATAIRDIAVWNGVSWSEVGGGIGSQDNAYLAAAASSGGNLYVAGDFDQVGGNVNSKDLAWWDGAQWHAYTGPAFGASGNLRAVAVKDNTIYVAGYFTNVGGTISYGLGKWTGTTWYNLADTPQYGTDTIVRCMAADGSGGLFAAGEFAYAGNTPVGHIAHFDGTEWTGLGTGLTGASLSVYALEHTGEDLFAGGRFTNAGGVTVSNLARWDGSWHDVGGGISGGSGLLYTIRSDGSDLYVGGSFSTAGSVSAANIARWDGTSWHGLGSGTNGSVVEMCVWNGLLYVGGNFSTAGGSPASHVATWDGSAWAQVGAGLNSGVNGFAVYNDELYASGTFTNSNGNPMTGIARWDGSAWSAVGGSLSSGANDIVSTPSGLYVCGGFSTAGGTPAAHMAKWTGTDWQTLGSGVGSTVYALALVDNYLYAGGLFYRAGDKASSCVARWDDAGAATGVDAEPALRAGLESCFPNPFNPSTTIRYRVTAPGRVMLAVYDVAGRHVRTLVDRYHASGSDVFVTTWDGRDDRGLTVASGVYFCRMESAGFSDTRKMVLLK
ncbi:MAG TPA: T9SS type A sorting domain-containing protein [Candidatus Krumholzibacteria bacterium]|nr:T9SS type A sorting domain-containing protein [Candidatus Krumholzibacteria bacterium]